MFGLLIGLVILPSCSSTSIQTSKLGSANGNYGLLETDYTTFQDNTAYVWLQVSTDGDSIFGKATMTEFTSIHESNPSRMCPGESKTAILDVSGTISTSWIIIHAYKTETLKTGQIKILDHGMWLLKAPFNPNGTRIYNNEQTPSIAKMYYATYASYLKYKASQQKMFQTVLYNCQHIQSLLHNNKPR
jgi:hypothetical protein